MVLLLLFSCAVDFLTVLLFYFNSFSFLLFLKLFVDSLSRPI